MEIFKDVAKIRKGAASSQLHNLFCFQKTQFLQSHFQHNTDLQAILPKFKIATTDLLHNFVGEKKQNFLMKKD